MTRARIVIVAVWVVLGATLPMAFAQSGGTLGGVVKDSSGAVLPGATVTLVNLATKQSREAVTNEAGAYTFVFVPPGDYGVTIDLSGFKRFARGSVRVNLGSAVVIDAALELGGLEETITVAGDSPQLQLTSSSLGSVVESQLLNGVPLSSRNFTQILSLSAGVSSPVADAGAFGRNSVNISANGARPWDNGVILNGLSADNAMSQGFDDTNDKTGVPVPAPDAIEEFKVQTGLYDAEYGKQAGAVINIATKSGGAAFHGSAYEFFRDDALNANDFFRNRSGLPKPVLEQNQFGGSLGGPLLAQKSFFFLSYQHTGQRNGVSSASTRNTFLPVVGDRTAAGLGALYGGRAGVFGGVAVAPDGSNINPIALRVLNAKLPNGEYVIPDPQIVLPNGSGFSAFSQPAKFTENQLVTNVDYNLSSAQRLSIKTFLASFPSDLPFSLSSNVFGFGEIGKKKNINLAALHTYVLSATTVNELRVGYNRSDMQQEPIEPLNATDIGMRQVVAEYPSIPRIAVAGMFTIGPDNNNDQRVLIQQLEIANTLSKIVGRHSLRFGGNISPVRVYRHEVFQKRGSLTFNSFPDFLLGMSGAQNGTSFSNVASSAVANGREDNHPRFLNYAAFAQDDFRLNDRLAFNIGLRYQFNGHQSDGDGLQANFDKRLFPAEGPPPEGTFAGIILPANSDVPVPPGVVKLDRNVLVDGDNRRGFSPRLGMTWRPIGDNQSVVVRAGYGLFWSAVAGTIAEQVFVNPPFYATITGGGNNFPSATFENPFPAVPQLPDFPLYTPFAIGGNRVVFTLDPEVKQPYSQEYSANVQAEVKGLLLEMAYVGSRTNNIIAFVRPNQAQLASPERPIRGQTTNTLQNLSLRVPYLGFAPTAISESQSKYSSRYNSLQLSVRKRYSDGLTFSGAYTLSKSIDNVSASGGGRNQPLGSFRGDYYNPDSNKGPSDFDRRHRFVASWLWEIPGFRGAPGLKGAVLDGWSLSGVGTLQSGLPFSIIDTRGGTIFGATSYAQLAPGVDPKSLVADGRTQDRLNAYFDTTAFVAPPSIGNGTGFGNAPRNSLRGPGQVNFDMALVKMLSIRQRNNIELRAEFFNVFNTPQFGLPGNSVTTASSFGIISSTVVSPRIMQLAARYRF
jgi:hypothetical protein